MNGLAPRSHYQQQIARIVPDVDPRHVEAWLRLQFGTLDHLEISTALLTGYADMARDYPAKSEELARSYGL